MKKSQITAFAAFIATSVSLSAATTISQTDQTTATGGAGVGFSFQLNTTTNSDFNTDALLTSIEMFRGSLGSGSGTDNTFLNIYTDTGSTPSFVPGSATTNATFIGSSLNSIDVQNSSDNASLLWTFNLDLSSFLDQNLYAVMSTTNIAGSSAGASLNLSSSSAVYSNITAADTDPIFNGSVSLGNAQEIAYNIALTAVPEPSSYALISGALALGWIMVRRRK